MIRGDLVTIALQGDYGKPRPALRFCLLGLTYAAISLQWSNYGNRR